MLQDARNLPDGQVLETDVCIAGAGAAGITLALELLDSGIDVVLLESGGFNDEKSTQSLYSGTVATERLHSPPDRYRQRRFGGSTTLWGGRCVPFDAIDFETRSYLPNSGWPITREVLEPHYRQRAMRGRPVCLYHRRSLQRSLAAGHSWIWQWRFQHQQLRAF